MKFLLILPLAAVLAIGCSRQDTSGQKNTPGKESQGGAQQDQKGLQGTWKIISIGSSGENKPSDMKVTISGQQYTTTKGGKAIEQATMTTDPSKQPKSIDLAFTSGEAKGQTLLGIYEVTGDTLRIAFAEPGQARPTEIVRRAGQRLDIWELRRE